MRNFFMENSIGERISLSEPGVLWLNLPEGLGMRMSSLYESPELGFWNATDIIEAGMPITGILVFMKNNVYGQFQTVTDWMLNSTGLKLLYKPYGDKIYYRDIAVDEIGKSEKRLHSFLECNIILRPLTPWYDQFSHTFIFNIETSEYHKRYSYRYPYTYAGAFVPGTVDFSVAGHYPGEINLYGEGPLASPVFILSNTNTGELYGKLDLSEVSIETGEALQYSSNVNNPGVWLIHSDGKKEDIIDYVELSPDTESFFKVPTNVPLTATMQVVGVLDAKVTLRVLQYFKLR